MNTPEVNDGRCMFDKNISRHSIEWKSLTLLLVVYMAWFSLLVMAAQTSLFWYAPFLAYVVAMQTSLQHEFLHGHPTRYQWLNDALVFMPLILWLPYSSYKKSHLQHHTTARLTHPQEDPESYYFFAEKWASMSSFHRLLYTFNNSMTGRLLVGPLIVITQVFTAELKNITYEGSEAIQRLVPHIVGVILVLTLLNQLGISMFSYSLMVIWPATSLMLLRSYYEHKPETNNNRCTAIIETNPVFSLLFLNNNLHVVHHLYPGLPWYKIPGVYREQREQFLAENGGYLVKGYTQLLFKYAFRAKDKPVYSL